MPWRAGADGRRHRSHAFPGSRDPSMLARAIDVEVDAVRSADGSIRARVRVEPAHVGHAFPTGDLFRRAELRVFVEGDEAHARTIGFARVFSDRMERARDGSLAIVRRQTGDTRVPPPGFGRSAPIDLVLAAPAESPRRDAVVRWSVDHLLMPTPMAASQGFGDARIRTVVSSGRVVARASDMEHGGMQ